MSTRRIYSYSLLFCLPVTALLVTEISAAVIHGEVKALLQKTEPGGDGPFDPDGSPAFEITRVTNGSLTVLSTGNGGDLELTLADSGGTLASSNDGFALISTSENGRVLPGDTAVTYATTAMRRFGGPGTWDDKMAIIMSPSPVGGEFNVNTNFAYFPQSEFIGGHFDDASTTDETNLDATGGLVYGANFLDVNDGTYLVDYTYPVSGSIDGRTDGILLACSAKNEDNYAMTRVNVGNAYNDGSFQILDRDNGNDGDGATPAFENDDVSWVYLPIGDPSAAALGRIDNEGDTIIGSGAYTVTNTRPGEWFLSVDGYAPSRATLIVTGAGDSQAGEDNIVTFEAGTLSSVDGWYIQSRDIPSMDLEGLGVDAPAFSFAVFVPEPTSTALCGIAVAFLCVRVRSSDHLVA